MTYGPLFVTFYAQERFYTIWRVGCTVFTQRLRL